jgi:hypothetical protein
MPESPLDGEEVEIQFASTGRRVLSANFASLVVLGVNPPA